MRTFCSVVLMLVLCVAARGNESFADANRSYENGQFEQAVSAYQGLLNNEGPRVSVLNNLGSAYFRLGDYGRAILAFERALILEPGDSGLRANLKLAQDQAVVFPESRTKGWRSFLAKISPDHQALLVLLAALLLPVCAFLMVRYRGRAALAGGVFFLCVVVIKMVLWPLKSKDDSWSRGIVLAAPATVRLSPFETADSRGTLSSGREVSIGHLENHFFWVEGNNGSTQGWVHEDEVAPVIQDKERGLAAPEG